MEGLGKNGGLIIDTVAEEKKKTERRTALNRPQINVFLYYDMNDIIMYAKNIVMLRGHASPSAHAASKDRLPSQRFFIRRQLNKSNQGLCTAHATMEEAGERASEGVHFSGRRIVKAAAAAVSLMYTRSTLLALFLPSEDM